MFRKEVTYVYEYNRLFFKCTGFSFRIFKLDILYILSNILCLVYIMSILRYDYSVVIYALMLENFKKLMYYPVIRS